MSKRFRIVKRISKEDTGHFEDIEVDDDFVDNEMVQIIADNEYDPLYDDCESIAVALQLAGYGKVADLEAKLAESEKPKELYRLQNEDHHLKLLQFYSRLGVEAFGADIHEKALETLMIMKEQLVEKEKEIENIKLCRCGNCTNEYEFMLEGLVEDLEKQIDKNNQDKISFALEQLEKAKNFCISAEDNGWCVTHKNWLEIVEYIDNQIKAIKGDEVV